MAIREGEVAGIPARVCRVSFSGELAYEVNVDGRRGLELWRGDRARRPYGTEAMHVLRAEKGYPIVGQDTDGTVTPQDLGLDWIVSKTKPDFVGKRSFARADTARADRKQLVGLLPAKRIAEGAQLVAAPGETAMLGHVTSSYDSVALGRPVRARARRAAAASGSARPSTRTGSPPRSSTRSSTTRRERAVTAVREVEIDAQVSLRGEPPMPSRTRSPATRSGSARTSGWCSAAARRTSPTPGRRSTSRRTASASSSRATGAAEVLAGGCALDLHPSVFPPGSCAQTLLARAQVILYRTDEHTFRILVRPSFADYLRAWLRDATE